MQSQCNPLIEDYTQLFYMIDERDVLSVECEVRLRLSTSMREVGGLSFIFSDFNVPALASRLSWIKKALQLSENINPLCDPFVYMQVSLAKRTR
jgi:hypothetical protein